jgi:hypothetical protein
VSDFTASVAVLVGLLTAIGLGDPVAGRAISYTICEPYNSISNDFYDEWNYETLLPMRCRFHPSRRSNGGCLTVGAAVVEASSTCCPRVNGRAPWPRISMRSNLSAGMSVRRRKLGRVTCWWTWSRPMIASWLA